MTSAPDVSGGGDADEVSCESLKPSVASPTPVGPASSVSRLRIGASAELDNGARGELPVVKSLLPFAERLGEAAAARGDFDSSDDA